MLQFKKKKAVTIEAGTEIFSNSILNSDIQVNLGGLQKDLIIQKSLYLNRHTASIRMNTVSFLHLRKRRKKGDSDFLVWVGGWLASSAECMEVIFWLLYYYQKKGNSISCAIFSKVEKGSPNTQVQKIKTYHKGGYISNRLIH